VSFPKLLFIIASIFGAFSLYKYISSERVETDYNEYKNSVQQAVQHFDMSAIALQTLLINQPPTKDEFINQYETGVVQEFGKGLQVLKTAEPKTKEIQEYKTIVVTYTEKDYQTLKEVGEALQQNDTNRVKSLIQEFRNSSVLKKQEMEKKKEEIDKKYNLNIDLYVD